MRLAGDADGCAAVARELARAAAQVDAGTSCEASPFAAEQWSGLGASQQQASALRRRARAAGLAGQLAAAAGSLAEFAERLADLQARGARLAATAAEEGLALDPSGDLPAVPVPYGPTLDPHALAEQRRAQHRAEVRQVLLGQVAALRADEDEAHRRLAGSLRDLSTVRATGGPGASLGPGRQDAAGPDPWQLGRWDLTAALSFVRATPLSELSPSGASRAGKVLDLVPTVPGLGVLAAGIGVAGDVENGYSVEGAVTKQAVVTAVASGAGTVVAGAGVLAAAPVVVTVVAGATVAVGIAYVGSRAWDATFGPEEPAPRRRSRRTARRATRPAGPPALDAGC